jgi:hypothetical protein
MKRLHITIVIAGLLCSSCSYSGPPVDLGEGFFLDLHGAAPTLHVPGHLELWIREKGRHRTVWKYIAGAQQIATNGICLFNGGLSSDPKWKGYPALLAYRSPGPVVEITERMTQKYCKENAKNYPDKRGKFAYLLRTFTNETFVLLGYSKPPGRLTNEEIVLRVSPKELIEMTESIKKTGEKRKYETIEYRIADPVD